MRKFYFVAICGVLIISSSFFFYSVKQKTAPIPVEVTHAKQKDVYNSVIANGTVGDGGIYNVVFAEDSTIQEIYVTLGQEVKKGEILMERKVKNAYPHVLTNGIANFTEQIISVFSEYGIHLKNSIPTPTVSEDETIIKSPVSGVVCELNVSPQEDITGFEVAAKVSDYTEMQVSVALSELYLSSISIGQEVHITGDAFPEKEYVGTVTKIASTASKKISLMGNEETYIPIEISLKNADSDLKPGYSVTARICTEKRKNAIVIPYDCIQQDDFGRELVYVVKDNVAYQKRIITGLELEDESEVLYGLDVGECVIRNPKEPLKSGQTVMVNK